MITAYLDKAIVDEIGKIGLDRAPAEACGVILPTPHKGKRVWEMPNRSKRMHDSFEMHGTDLEISLTDYPGNFAEILIWHTHPNGGMGPSTADLQHRHTQVGNLVVTLLEDGTAKATFY